MKTNNIYIDFHILQTVPPSCVNRDDTGSPKTAVYGGKTRARVSSQSWKHAMREDFKDIFSENLLGARTKRVGEMIEKSIHELAPGKSLDDCKKLAEKACKSAGLKGAEVDALLFVSKAQAEALAKLAVDGEKDNKLYKKAINDLPSIDMVLFGRMVASDPTLNYDAAAQVAHSISTHEVHNEDDYFTAVDDLAPEDNSGAGHLGTVEFNSSTLYRYANVNVKELFRGLGKDTAAAVKGFAEALITSMPTGKQNTFANRTFPDMVYVTVRTDQPINLAGAFENPVKSNEGYVKASEKAFKEYAYKIYNEFASEPETAWNVGDEIGLSSKKVSLKELLEELEAKVNSML